jgi:hypothetical protein
MLRSQTLPHLKLEFSASSAGDGPDAPPGLCSKIGGRPRLQVLLKVKLMRRRAVGPGRNETRELIILERAYLRNAPHSAF